MNNKGGDGNKTLEHLARESRTKIFKEEEVLNNIHSFWVTLGQERVR